MQSKKAVINYFKKKNDAWAAIVVALTYSSGRVWPVMMTSLLVQADTIEHFSIAVEN